MFIGKGVRRRLIEYIAPTDLSKIRAWRSARIQPQDDHEPRHQSGFDEERTLTVEVFDNRSKELVWVGWSKRTGSRPVKVEKLQEALRAILAQFPPAR